MSVQEALGFIRKVREDRSLRERIEALDREAALESLVELGKESGYTFSEEDLRTAFAHDWAMRWFRAKARRGE